MKPSAMNVKLVRYAAAQQWKRIKALNLSLDWEDVEQEASLVWVIAEKAFDSTKGFSFSTYFMTCARNHFNALIGDMYKPDEVGECKLGVVLDDLALDEGENPEREVSIASEISKKLVKLSSLANTLLNLAYQPDEFAIEQFNALRAKSQFASQKLQIDERFPPELNLRFAEFLLGKLGVPKKELIKARNEILEMDEHVR